MNRSHSKISWPAPTAPTSTTPVIAIRLLGRLSPVFGALGDIKAGTITSHRDETTVEVASGAGHVRLAGRQDAAMGELRRQRPVIVARDRQHAQLHHGCDVGGRFGLITIEPGGAGFAAAVTSEQHQGWRLGVGGASLMWAAGLARVDVLAVMRGP